MRKAVRRAGFIGRERELAELAGVLDAARAGSGAVVLVEGEPGMGKTALANEAVHRAREQGWVSAWGSCQESDGAPAYWPWIQVLRGLEGARELLVEGRESSRFRLFDEMIEVLRRSSSGEGLLIVLDDLHAAELASLRLLHILAAEISKHRMLVLGLHRRADPDARCAEVLSALARERAVLQFTLGGLSRAELAQLTELTLGKPAEPALVRTVAGRSEGNPFFALALLGLVRETGALGPTPPHGVREALGRRLDTVAVGTRQLLRVASVLGREFTASRLVELAGQPVGAVLGLLDEALARELVVASGSHTFRFAHALIQEVAYAELPLLERQRLHERAAAALGADESAIDAFAHHLRQAASLGCAPQALTATLRAAVRARNQLAYEHAAFQFGQALELLPLLPDSPVTRTELLLDLARCQFRSGAVADAWQSCSAAAELGLASGQAGAVADAATVIRGISNANADPLCGEIHALCRQALVLLDGADPVREARVLAQLAITADAFASSGDAERSERALRLAETTGDPDARSLALQARQVELVHPRHLLERLSIGEQAAKLGQESGQHEYLAWGHVWRMDAFWELGQRAQLDRELAGFATVAQYLKEPLLRWRLTMIQACLAEIEGRFGEARELADEALSIGRRGNHRGAEFIHLIFRSRMARLTGMGAEEAEIAVRRFAEGGPPGARGWHALQLVALGRIAEAADAHAVALSHIAEFPPHAPEWIPARTGMAIMCARLRSREPAGLLYDDLLPFAGRQAAAGAVTGSEGPVGRYLGMLALLLGDHEAAQAHLKAALESSLAMNSPPDEALTRLEIARLLLARRGPGDLPAAREYLEIALSIARRLGMAPLEGDAAELLPQIAPLSVREGELAALIAEGLSNRQIAQRLHLSERTVESHVRNILTKLGFERRTQIASWHTRSH